MKTNNPIDSCLSTETSPSTRKPSLACTLQAKRNYYQRHKERILESHKAWRERNKDRLKELQKTYQKRYKEKKDLELNMLQKLVEARSEEDDENDFMNRLEEVIHIASFYKSLGIERPIDFY
jgi:uncharacterized protein (DUF885 family)